MPFNLYPYLLPRHSFDSTYVPLLAYTPRAPSDTLISQSMTETSQEPHQDCRNIPREMPPSSNSEAPPTTEDGTSPGICMDIIEDLSEAELDRRILAIKKTRTLKRKREELKALQRGESPPGDTQTSTSSREPSPKRMKTSDWGKLTYKGGTKGDLHRFLFQVKARFDNVSDLSTDLQKVAWVTSCLEGPVERRWISRVRTTYQDNIKTVTWENMENWLKRRAGEGEDRSYDATSKLRRMYQRPWEKFDDFLNRWEETEMEVVDILPESLQVAHLLAAMTGRLRDTIALKGIPKTREELILEAQRVEVLLGPRDRSVDRDSTQTSQRNHYQTLDPRQPSSEATANRKDECLKCGKPHHPTSRCPDIQCYQCKEMGHISPFCPKRRTQDTDKPRASRAQ